MSEGGFFNNFKNIFNNKKAVEIKKEQPMVPRKVNFGVAGKQQKRIVKMGSELNDPEYHIEVSEESNDARYDHLDKIPAFKDIGLKKDQIVEGELPILYQTKFVFCRMHGEKYQQVTLLQTNFKLAIKPINHHYYFFPLGKIEKLHKYSNNENVFKILILLKDGRKFKFKLSIQSIWKKIYQKIQCFAFIRVKKYFFAFKHFETDSSIEEKYQGWSLYDPIRQFGRMKIKLMPHCEETQTEYWSDFKILDNRDGKICNTYPSLLVVPSRMPYDYLVRCSKFRSRSRMPALTYAYEYQKGKFSTIYRSSQSKVGVQNSRCAQDQIMLKIIGDHSLHYKDEKPHHGPKNCMIYDARNYIAALGNKFSGKGFEYEQFYRNCELDFLNIPNIHAVRDSYNKAVKASFGEDLKFHINLADSQWYDYVFLILAGAIELAKNLRKGYNNLVHCSDGWDRTAQLCSLAQIIVDPFYRTMKGFQILIEKDWIHFGHQFATRLAQGMNNPNSQQKSQVFIQYLDCVSQMLYQYPSQFEFNYAYLQEICQQAYSHQYGNFLCNCELEMEKNQVSKRTISLWSHLAANKDNFMNPYYVESGRLLQISSAQKHMRFWKEHFLQYVDGFRDVYDIYSCKFTEDNLQVMHQQLKKEQQLLFEKYQQNQKIIDLISNQINVRLENNQNKNPQVDNNQVIVVDPKLEVGKSVEIQIPFEQILECNHNLI